VAKKYPTIRYEEMVIDNAMLQVRPDRVDGSQARPRHTTREHLGWHGLLSADFAAAAAAAIRSARSPATDTLPPRSPPAFSLHLPRCVRVQMALNPTRFDVMVMPNLYGDIASGALLLLLDTYCCCGARCVCCTLPVGWARSAS